MSLLALLYILISPLLAKRYSVKWQYYAWLVVVIGLIIPFRPQWGNAIVQVDIPNETAKPIIQIMSGTETPFIPIDNETLDVVIAPIENAPNYPIWAGISIWQIIAFLWIIGVIGFFAYHVIRHYRFLKLIKRWSERITDERILNLFENLKAEMKISKNINLYHSSCMGSPMMFGLINPRIVLPTEKISEDELRFILKHELVHYKRKDLYYKFIVLITTAIHWFNPLIYLMVRVINEQCELSCDAEIIRGTDADTRLKYSEAIIGVVNYKSRLKTILSTNFYGGKKGMKKRISSIMDTGNKRIGIVIISILLIATVCTGFAFAGNRIDSDNYDENQDDILREIAGLSNSYTKDGITISIESVYGGNTTFFGKLKVESETGFFDDDIFNTKLSGWCFATDGIDYNFNSENSSKGMISSGGGSIREIEKESWTPYIRYFEIQRSVILFDANAGFSIGNGNEHIITFTDFGSYDENYQWVTLIEGDWRLKFSFDADTDDRDIDVIFSPFMFYGKGLMGNERPAQMTSIRLNKYGMECKYTAYEIQEALDFAADVILKDGTKIPLNKKSTGCGIDLEGYMTFKTSSALNLDEIAYIQIGDEFIAVN